ncbi:MAG TPA: dUTP diphosphatase [Thermoanaerobaculia bacterium]|nr:dUTP diphosphatase [Thermoanaerobaculia bacterium]
MTVRLRVLRLPAARDLPLPAPASAGSSGFDLRAAIDGELTLRPGERLLVPTGLALEIPAGWEGQVRPRSGLALRHGIGMVNAPGTIDSDYRGEVGVLLINLGAEPFTLRRGERIAQLVIARVESVVWEEAQALEGSGRGEGGFGSTGR